ncbi:MAG: sensor histidine kinase [Bacteroidetes bacterium]|nr:MAG: sensor histidine kinase [Bacteroidota bacterium]
MKNSIIFRVVFFGILAVVGIIALQVYLLKKTWDVQEQEFNEKVVIALQSVAKGFEKLGSPLPSYDIIKQVSSNYYVVNINDDIDANNLEYFLRKELEEVGLTETFEYSIYDCETNEMVYGGLISYSPGEDTSNIKKEALPVYNEFPYYFGVRFPNREGHIFSSMRMTAIFAIILGITLLFFLYSIFVILRQKRLSEMQKDFINNMTHEFKTPISTINISADVFLSHNQIQSDKRLRQYAHIIKDQSQRLNGQVEKVLQLARIEKDNFRLSLEEVNFHELLEDILSSIRLKVESEGGELVCHFNAHNARILADRLHLTNILYNLLDNALKYCKDAPRITLSTEDKGRGFCFKIKDQGIGIAKEQQAKVFKKFYRVPTGNVHNIKGFGLGLFYVKNICQAHGWKLHLESEEGAGTTISIFIKNER